MTSKKFNNMTPLLMTAFLLTSTSACFSQGMTEIPSGPRMTEIPSGPQQSAQEKAKQEKEEQRIRKTAARFPLPKGFQNIHLYMPLPKFLKVRNDLRDLDPDPGQNPRNIDPENGNVRLGEEIKKHSLFNDAEYAFMGDGSLRVIFMRADFPQAEARRKREELLASLISLYGAPSHFDVVSYGRDEKSIVKSAGVYWDKGDVEVFAVLSPQTNEPGNIAGVGIKTKEVDDDFVFASYDYVEAGDATAADRSRLLPPVRDVVERLVGEQKSRGRK